MPNRAFVLPFVLLLHAAGCGRAATADSGAPPQGAPAVPVRTAVAAVRPVPDTIDAVGTVEASSLVDIRPQVSGSLLAIHFVEGADVKAGALLFTIDPAPFAAAVEAAQSALARDQALLDNASAELRRNEALAREGLITAEQLDAARTSARAALATLAADEAAVDTAKVQLGRTRITAPVSGRTGSLQVHVGDLLQADVQGFLVSIAQLKPARAVFSVPSQVLARARQVLQAGNGRADLKGDDGRLLASDGRIVFLDNAVDATTGTIRMKAEFANQDGRLWPGLFVNVVLHLGGDAPALVVPASAVQQGQVGPYVFVVKADHTVDVRQIQVAPAGSELVRVTSGLEEGDIVVTDGQVRLAPGMRVAP